MRRLATAAIICAALAGGSAQAQTQTAADVLAGTRWGWLGFESDLTKITETEIQAAGKKACSKPNLAFRRQGDQLTKLDYVVDPPSPTTYPKSRVLTKDDTTIIMLFYSADGTKPDASLMLSRGNTILSSPDKLFGTWHYVRCQGPGDPAFYDTPASSGRRGGR